MMKFLSQRFKWWQAIIFYLVGMLATIFVSAFLVWSYMHLTHSLYIKDAVQLKLSLTVLVLSTLLAILIVRAKGVYNWITIGGIIVTAAFSMGGALYSYIPIAYLTTRPRKA
jgi:hypothetical protein